MIEVMRRLRLPVVALMFGTVTACSGGGSEPVPVDTRTPLERAEAKIAPDAVMLMDKADYSKTYAKLGADQFNRANNLTRWAAVAAAEAPNCERVELIGLSDQSEVGNASIPPKRPLGARVSTSQVLPRRAR